MASDAQNFVDALSVDDLNRRLAAVRAEEAALKVLLKAATARQRCVENSKRRREASNAS